MRDEPSYYGTPPTPNPSWEKTETTNSTNQFFDGRITTKREEVLDEAKRLIVSDREDQYGPPVENFKNIADLWNIRFQKKLKEPLTGSDVAVAMLLLKIARDIHGYKEDSAVDSAAYAALYAEVETALQKESKS